MSVFEQRLSVIAETNANLYTRLRELERLRDQIERAEMLVRESQPESVAKRPQISNQRRMPAAA
jgi:hypothetical protein